MSDTEPIGTKSLKNADANAPFEKRLFLASYNVILCKERSIVKINWQKLILKIFFWLLLEAIFNLLGIDDLADYSEFLLMPKITIQSNRFFAQ